MYGVLLGSINRFVTGATEQYAVRVSAMMAVSP